VPVTVLAATIASALAGCGSGTKTVIVQGPPTASTTATKSTTSTAMTVTTPASSSEAPVRIVRLASFRSPTGNIGCMLVGPLARCDIVTRSWSPPPRPADCPHIVDYGQGLEVSPSGAARFVCAGDTVRDPASSALPYGVASRKGPFLCTSRATGMTCVSRASGHGFTLSIQGYQVF
jgi:hypothetical protein